LEFRRGPTRSGVFFFFFFLKERKDRAQGIDLFEYVLYSRRGEELKSNEYRAVEPPPSLRQRQQQEQQQQQPAVERSLKNLKLQSP